MILSSCYIGHSFVEEEIKMKLSKKTKSGNVIPNCLTLSNDIAVFTAAVEPSKNLNSLPSAKGVQPRTCKVRLTSQGYRCSIKASELMSISGINCKMRIMLVIRYFKGNVLIFKHAEKHPICFLF